MDILDNQHPAVQCSLSAGPLNRSSVLYHQPLCFLLASASSSYLQSTSRLASMAPFSDCCYPYIHRGASYAPLPGPPAAPSLIPGINSSVFLSHASKILQANNSGLRASLPIPPTLLSHHHLSTLILRPCLLSSSALPPVPASGHRVPPCPPYPRAYWVVALLHLNATRVSMCPIHPHALAARLLPRVTTLSALPTPPAPPTHSLPAESPPPIPVLRPLPPCRTDSPTPSLWPVSLGSARTGPPLDPALRLCQPVCTPSPPVLIVGTQFDIVCPPAESVVSDIPPAFLAHAPPVIRSHFIPALCCASPPIAFSLPLFAPPRFTVRQPSPGLTAHPAYDFLLLDTLALVCIPSAPPSPLTSYGFPPPCSPGSTHLLSLLNSGSLFRCVFASRTPPSLRMPTFLTASFYTVSLPPYCTELAGVALILSSPPPFASPIVTRSPYSSPSVLSFLVLPQARLSGAYRLPLRPTSACFVPASPQVSAFAAFNKVNRGSLRVSPPSCNSSCCCTPRPTPVTAVPVAVTISSGRHILPGSVRLFSLAMPQSLSRYRLFRHHALFGAPVIASPLSPLTSNVSAFISQDPLIPCPRPHYPAGLPDIPVRLVVSVFHFQCVVRAI